MTDLSDLIARVEASEGPNYALEEALFEALMIPTEWFGSKVISHFRCDSGRYGFNTEDGYRHLDCVRPPPVTASVDSALALIGERFPGWACSVVVLTPEPCEAYVWERGRIDNIQGKAPTPALALILALLKGVRAGSSTNPTDGTVVSSRGGG